MKISFAIVSGKEIILGLKWLKPASTLIIWPIPFFLCCAHKTDGRCVCESKQDTEAGHRRKTSCEAELCREPRRKMIIPVRCFTCGKVPFPIPKHSLYSYYFHSLQNPKKKKKKKKVCTFFTVLTIGV